MRWDKIANDMHWFRRAMWGYRRFGNTKALDLGFFTIYWR